VEDIRRPNYTGGPRGILAPLSTPAPAARPRLSVVVPARNAAGTLERCLAAIQTSAAGLAEVFVVDDGSVDGTADVARSMGATVIRRDRSGGPAAARNLGANRAAAEILLFVDADMVLAETAIPRVLQTFTDDPFLAATFGSYDDQPEAGTLVSDYRNLLHHYVHQHSNTESGFFWAGCGAMRRKVFLSAGGFDETFSRPSIEDLELGARLARAGFRIRLDPDLQARHLKRWTLASMTLVDVRDRAYPWGRWILEQGAIPTDLNLRHEHRASAALVWLALLATLAALVGAPISRPAALVTVFAALTGVGVLNREFYLFLLARRGAWFTAGAAALHAIYYAYASATFAWCWLSHHGVRTAGIIRRNWRLGIPQRTSSR
jgi:hypothetical protein